MVKVQSTSTVQVISQNLLIEKKVYEKNVGRGTVSISEAEKRAVSANDNVTVRAVNKKDGTVLGERTFTGKDFHKKLVKMEKESKSGYSVAHFYIIRCYATQQ